MPVDLLNWSIIGLTSPSARAEYTVSVCVFTVGAGVGDGAGVGVAGDGAVWAHPAAITTSARATISNAGNLNRKDIVSPHFLFHEYCFEKPNTDIFVNAC